MANPKFSKSKQTSIIADTLSKKRSLAENSNNFKVSFQYLETTQRYGSGFKDWQKDGLLSRALEVLQGYCCRPLLQQVDGVKFTIYGDFPKSTHTYFKKPNNIPEDANWARIHITGVSILAGHVLSDTFYVVFLDKSHKFYLTERAREKKDR